MGHVFEHLIKRQLCASDKVILKLVAELDKISAVAGYSNEQILIFFRPFLRIYKGLPADYAELALHPLIIEVGIHEAY